MQTTALSIMAILSMIVAVAYLIVYSMEKNGNNHKLKNYKLYFAVIMVALIIITQLIKKIK